MLKARVDVVREPDKFYLGGFRRQAGENGVRGSKREGGLRRDILAEFAVIPLLEPGKYCALKEELDGLRLDLKMNRSVGGKLNHGYAGDCVEHIVRDSARIHERSKFLFGTKSRDGAPFRPCPFDNTPNSTMVRLKNVLNIHLHGIWHLVLRAMFRITIAGKSVKSTENIQNLFIVSLSSGLLPPSWRSLCAVWHSLL